jgi:hypothetical protein
LGHRVLRATNVGGQDRRDPAKIVTGTGCSELGGWD